MDPGRRVRRLGVVGTLVWDTIHRSDVRPARSEEWGGIGYALESLSVSLPRGWEVVPFLKVGRDLSEEAFRYLRELPRVRITPGVQVVPEANNRVELRYTGQHRQAERLSGGVPPWEWAELRSLATACDALYVNFISGFEMDLETAQALRAGFRGPIYADLHSLFLGVGSRGDRIPRALPHWAEWLRSFDAVQMNELEFELLGRVHGDPWELAAAAVGTELRLILVTLGARGAAFVACAGALGAPLDWGASRGGFADPGPAVSGKVEVADRGLEGDPTGCGDVWGSTLFARLLAGDAVEGAMARANEMAARNLLHRGARGLRHHLMGRVHPGEDAGWTS